MAVAYRKRHNPVSVVCMLCIGAPARLIIAHYRRCVDWSVRCLRHTLSRRGFFKINLSSKLRRMHVRHACEHTRVYVFKILRSEKETYLGIESFIFRAASQRRRSVLAFCNSQATTSRSYNSFSLFAREKRKLKVINLCDALPAVRSRRAGWYEAWLVWRARTFIRG